MSSTQPGPEFRGERLLPSLYRVFAWNSMPEEVFCCDVYAISHPEGVVLVDVGDQRPRCAERIYENLAAQGLRPEEVTHALLTHYHIDHGYGAHYFRQRGVKIVGHPDADASLRRVIREVAGEFPEAAAGAGVDVIVRDGEGLDLRGLKVRCIHTPGHTAGCMSYLVEFAGARCLFTGDLVRTNGDLGYCGDEEFDSAKLLMSLRRLVALRPDALLTGHGFALEEGWRGLEEGVRKGSSGAWEEAIRQGDETRRQRAQGG